MKKLSLIIAACTLSFLSLSSYADVPSPEQIKGSIYQCSSKIEKFTAPNLEPDPRVNNS